MHVHMCSYSCVYSDCETNFVLKMVKDWNFVVVSPRFLEFKPTAGSVSCVDMWVRYFVYGALRQTDSYCAMYNFSSKFAHPYDVS